MTKFVQDKIAEFLFNLEEGDLLPGRSRIYWLVSLAGAHINSLVAENDRLRKANSDMGWELNPDRMGGQFTEEEMNRSGWL